MSHPPRAKCLKNMSCSPEELAVVKETLLQSNDVDSGAVEECRISGGEPPAAPRNAPFNAETAHIFSRGSHEDFTVMTS